MAASNLSTSVESVASTRDKDRNLLSKIEKCVAEIEAKQIDLTSDYQEWINLGLSLSELGESGRDSFHRVSKFHPDYSYMETDKKYNDCLSNRNGSVTIGTFFQKCKDAGVNFSLSGDYSPRPTPTSQKALEEEKWLFNIKDVKEAPPQETIWSFIVKGVNNAFVASSEAGKSTLLLNLCIAIAREKESFLEWPLNATKGRCIYVSTEDGISQIQHRLKSMLGDKFIDDDGIQFILDGKDFNNRLKAALKKYPSDLVIIDTWGDFVGGDYDAKSTRSKMAEIRTICKEYDATPIYVHHTNKLSENIPDKSSIKGAGDFEQACRVVMFLSIYQDKRWLCCVKGNPFPEDHKSTCYEMDFNSDKNLFSRSGNEKSRYEIIQELRSETMGRPKIEIDFSIMKGERMSNKRLTDLIMAEYPVSRGTAQSRIKEAFSKRVLGKDSNGAYYEV